MRYFRFIILILTALTAGAQTTGDQADERIDPTLEVSGASAIDYSRYRFVNTSKNHIQLNGSDWTALADKFDAAICGDTCFTIVYLGDSHIQADFGGSVLRERLAGEAGSAGRGLIIPFKMAGTNQPVDYTITTDNTTESSRLLKKPWSTRMPFTGIGVQPKDGSFKLHVTADEPFDRVRLMHRGMCPETIRARHGVTGQDFQFTRVNPTEIYLEEPCADIELELAVPADFVLAGLVLTKADAGVFVHSIGNNGATYGTYNEIDRFGHEIKQLNPDLIIIALGTNEAFGTFSSTAMRAEVDRLVKELQRSNPESALLLVTPTECFRKRYRRRRVVGTTVNTKVRLARNVVYSYAMAQGIPLYDTYEIVGSDGAATRMKRANVLGRDGVHFTSEGYRLQGSLLADAILEQFLRPAENTIGQE